MTDREKVIKGLTACVDDMCDYCPYYDEEVPDCDYYGRCNRIDMNRDALALLKEQAEVIDRYHKADVFLNVHGWRWDNA